ncbi:PREDICTED: ankyrin repeat-containing protein At5g02620-like [Ipomoea nil]|uniref:ankyrin repeat-containing protein At5g02620-like n=1 Tax=Ipomoea nil TaxID=35883 RepID=UPI0009016364|nr:PREDICTED: ankyrin repeat-containing protein At5g02620-like [Ipomoea nil]
MAAPSQALPQNPDDFCKYRPLYRAILAANWEQALIFFNHDASSIQSPLTNDLETALHVGAKAGNASFMEKLVSLLSDHELGPRDVYGLTPLHIAARHGNIEVAHILVGRNSNLLYLQDNNGSFAIHYAVTNNLPKSKEAFVYFLGVTRDDEYGHPNPYAGPSGVSILVNLILYKFYGTYTVHTRPPPTISYPS